MQQLQLFQIDAFTDEVFHGNPAAVCPLEYWLDNTTLQAIARENHLSETAFFVPRDDGFHIRWFTPIHEVPLCGHATLASAFVIFTELDPECQFVRFESKSGPLQVMRQGAFLTMDFPAFHMTPCQSPPDGVLQGLNRQPQEVLVVDADPNYYAIFPSEEEVRSIAPDLNVLAQLHPYGVVVTAPGNQSDCVSRYFAPSYGIPEDPVTGSIHSALVPYWAKRLNKSHIHASQASQRGGELFCEAQGERVLIGGHAVKYLTGTISI
jgi:PhzF family phenazine biosynthesis protein